MMAMAIGQGLAGMAQAAMRYEADMEQARAVSLRGKQAIVRSELALQQAASVKLQGVSLMQELGARYQDTVSQGLGAYAGGNVQVGAGSAKLFEIDTARLAAIDMAAAEQNIAQDVWAMETEAQQLLFEGQEYKRTAQRMKKIAKASFIINAASSWVGTAQGNSVSSMSPTSSYESAPSSGASATATSSTPGYTPGDAMTLYRPGPYR